MVALPPALRLSRWARLTSTVQGWARAALTSISALRRPPPPPGLAHGRIARAASAESEIGSLARSPTVYGAVTGRALSLSTYPIRVYLGYGISSDAEPLDPDRVAWAGALLRLLSRPDPLDLSTDALFPAHPGEGLLSQLLADLILAGNAYVVPTLAPSGAVIGLTRLHPQLVTLIRAESGESWRYQAPGQPVTLYPRRTVAHLRLLSWQARGSGELGTGAGAPLAHLVEAEAEALRQTAQVVRQGGADALVTGATDAGMAFLQSKENRDRVAEQITTALSGGEDGTRRVMVLGGPLKIEDLGLSPADLRAPETLAAARASELVALGTTPVTVGADAGAYSTAVQQLRVQALSDEALVYVLEYSLLRPLARRFAALEGGRWAAKADRVTCRLDLSGHPGYAYLRTEAIARARALVELGWSPEQAATAEGLDLPAPEGEPWRPVAPGAPPGAPPAGEGARPRRPVGEPEEAAPEAGEPPSPPERLSTWWRAADPPAPEPAVEEARSIRWRAVEEARGGADRDLETAAQAILDLEREDYSRRVVAALQDAQLPERHGRAAYGPLPWVEILGPLTAAADRWFSGLSPDWRAAWAAARDRALDGTGREGEVPSPGIEDGDLDPLRDSAEGAAQTSRDRVQEIVQAGIDRGATINEIQRDLQADQIWAPPRALRVARTETVRAETGGQQRRYQAAADAGLTVRQEWLTSRDASVRPSHRPLDGQIRDLGATWQIPGGPATPGPARSGDPGEDSNCRCTTIPIVE